MSHFNRQTLELSLVDQKTRAKVTGPAVISIRNLDVGAAQGARLRLSLEEVPDPISIPELIAVPLGRTRISVTAEGYHPKSEFLIIDSADVNRETLELVPRTAVQTLEGPPVQLGVDSQENFTISPTTRVVEPGDTIEWSVPEGQLFAIHFNGSNTPFREVLYRNSRDVPSVRFQVPPDANPGVYEYAVALYDGEKVSIHVSGEVRVKLPF